MPNATPAQLSAKNLTYLSEALGQEALACKKCSQYSSMLLDPALQQLSTSLAQRHKDRYNNLLQYLNSEN